MIYRNKQNEFHRLDGPAVEYTDGTKLWYVNGQFHRKDGPAIEFADGSVGWFLNGKYHRLDGPAVENVNGYKEWWIDGIRCSEKNYLVFVVMFLLNCDKKIAKMILNYFIKRLC
jgi:hypothetical protein